MTCTKFKARLRLLPLGVLAMALGVPGAALAVAGLEPAAAGDADRAADVRPPLLHLLDLRRHLRRRLRRDVLFDLQAPEVAGPQGGPVPREHDRRDRLDGDPVPDPAVHGVPGDQDHPRDEGHVGARTSRSRSPATSGSGTTTTCRRASASTRTSSTPLAQIENREPKGEHYLLEVDNPLVVPVDTKVRVLITAGDVLHAWWVPAFGVKQDAIPGFVRDAWFKAEKIGIYRGQCAELCGKEHGFMPIVVEVKSKDDYAKWVDEQKTQDRPAPAPTRTRSGT